MTRLLHGLPAEPIAAHAGAPLLTQAAGFAQITLNRPAEHNRIDPADIDALLPLLARLAAQTAPGGGAAPLRALVITGTGERTFSSGYTLQAIVTELDDRFERMLDALETLPCLTIAALNGSVYGGATDLALACDIRIGTPGLKMFMPAAKFGLHYYPGGLRRYVTRLGLPTATRLMLTAMTLETEEMLRVGFLSEVVDRSALEDRVEAYLAQTTLTEPLVVGQMKRHLQALAQRAADEPEARALHASMAQATADSLRSPALKARLEALLKR